MNTDQLADTITNLAQQVGSLREAIDTMQSSLRWGLQNDKFGTDPAIVAEASKEVVREELAGLRTTIEDAAHDATWAANQIKTWPSQAITDLQETLQEQIADVQASMDALATEFREVQGKLFQEA